MLKIEIEKWLDFKFISELKSNKTETWAAFIKAEANLKNNNYTYDLFITDGKTKKRALHLKEHNRFIFEGEHSLIFPFYKLKKEKDLKNEKINVYYRYHILTGELEKAYQINTPLDIVECLGDKLLLSGFITDEVLKLYDLEGKERKEYLKKLSEDNLYEDINEIPFYSNGFGHTANKRHRLFLYDIASKKISSVGPKGFDLDSYHLSLDQNTLYLIGRDHKHIKEPFSKVYQYDILTNNIIPLYERLDYAINRLHVLSDKLVVEASDMKHFGLNENDKFYELKDQRLTLLHDLKDSIGNSIGSDVRLGKNKQYWIKDGLYFLTTTIDHSSLNKLRHDGSVETIYEMDGSIDGFTYLNDTWLVVGQHKQKLQEIYTLDLPLKKLSNFTTFNRISLSKHYIAKPREVKVKTKTHEVKGYVLLPKDFNKFAKYPMILNIHGGPKTVYGKIYYHEMQVWANMGYVVIFANPRGSDGKGDEYADIRGKYGTIDYDDLINFTDLVLKRYKQIDQKRLYVTGGSYGGFMTNWIVSHTDKFKAAVSQRSISNWLSFYGTSDIGYYFTEDQTAGNPIIDTDKLWTQSPLKYAHAVKTPTLFIHSDEDYRCPIEQALQFYTVIKNNGVDSKLIWFKGENHELSRSGKPQARIKRLKEITNWFVTHTD